MLKLAGYKIIQKLEYPSTYEFLKARRDGERGTVLLKVISNPRDFPIESRNLQRDFQYRKDLDSLHVLQPFNLLEKENYLVLVQEDLGGLCLDEYLESKEKLSLKQKLRLAIQVTECLRQVHSREIIHGRINGENFLINTELDALKLRDFSAARRVTIRGPEKVPENFPINLPAWVSPEQTGRVNTPLDYRSDIYSLGILIYKIFTGELPFQSEDPLELIHSHLARKPISPGDKAPKIPKNISHLILKLLAKSPDDRYQSVSGLYWDLRYLQALLEEGHGIEDFTPGYQDYHRDYRPPDKLYGRQSEIESINRVFDGIHRGGRSVVFVSGYSGVGKTALLDKVKRRIEASEAYFISGKFDQYKKTTPYTAVSDAFAGLVRILLAEEEESQTFWKERINEFLSPNAGVIIEMIPELEILLGPAADVPELNPLENQNRLHLVFQKFIQALSRPAKPLVIFLDDLQWADRASLTLINLLTTNPNVVNLLLLGAFRNNEVNENHPLTETINTLKLNPETYHQINLEALHKTDIADLLAHSLESNLEKVAPLAQLIYTKTRGNPFFTHQFMRKIFHEKLIHFNETIFPGNNRIHDAVPAVIISWDVKEIAIRTITDNVVEFLLERMRHYTPEQQQILSLASCIGGRFDLKTLSIISEKQTEKLAEIMNFSISQGLVEPAGMGSENGLEFKFGHDRIQQAAYALIENKSKAQVHLKIGQLLNQNVNDSNREEHIFDIVRQLNQGSNLILGQEKKLELVRLNIQAVRKANQSAAFVSSLSYLRIAETLLPKNSFDIEYDLSMEFYETLARCLFLNHQRQETLQIIDNLLERTRTNEDKIRLLKFRSLIYTNVPNLTASKNSYLQALEFKGIQLYSTPAAYAEAVEKEYLELQTLLPADSLKSLLDLPVLKDQDKIDLIDLLVFSWLPLFQTTNKEIADYMIQKAVRLSIEQGNAETSPSAYVIYGAQIGMHTGDFARAFRFGMLALRLNERLQARKYSAHTIFWHAINLNHYGAPVQNSLELYDQAYRFGCENGDLMHAGYSVANYMTTAFLAGNTVNDLYEIFKIQRQRGLAVGYVDDEIFFEIHFRYIEALAGKTRSLWELEQDNFDESKHIERISQDLEVLLLWIQPQKMLLGLLAGKYAENIGQAQKLERIVQMIPNSFYADCYYFFYALSVLLLGKETEVEPLPSGRTVSQILGEIENRAKACPRNYEYQISFIKAEIARKENNLNAWLLYDQAIKEAGEGNFLHMQAFASERAAQYWYSLDKPDFADLYIQRAMTLYQQWGATAKVNLLRSEYPEVFKEPSGSKPRLNAGIERNLFQNNSVDLSTIFKATRSISEEVDLQSLLRTLMKIIIENAGAERGLLILRQNQELLIEGEIDFSSDELQVLHSLPLKDGPPAPESVIRFVIRTGERVLLASGENDSRFQKDPYILEKGVRSLLCIPIQKKKDTIGAFLLENKAASGSFSEDRIEILQILISQAAISIENARLFQERIKAELEIRKLNEDLEARVQERTARLEVLNRELEAFSYSISHDLRQPLRGIEGFTEILIEDYSEVLGPEGLGLLKRVRNSSLHLTELVDGLLNLSRLNQYQLLRKKVNLTSIATRIITNLKAEDKNRESKIHIQENLIGQGDERLLMVVMQNLLDNAWKYSSQKPITEIELGMLEPDDPKGADLNPGQKKHPVYFIRDKGAGFNMKYSEKLFRAFQRMHRPEEFEGTGIGLATVQRIITRHNGLIKGEGEKDKGATFYFTLGE